jgi:cyclopropane-fatty-acyl-phospholipid synthase
VATSASAGVRRLAAVEDGALLHSRRILGSLFGPPATRGFDARYWDGTTERSANPSRFTFVVARPGALRAMLLPPSELSIAEAYLSGDVDIEGDLAAALSMNDAINRSVRSPRVVASLARDLIAPPPPGARARKA